MQDHVSAYERAAGTMPSPASLRRISWGAILAGVAVALSIQLLLNLLGVGIGASTVNVSQGDTPGSGLAIGAGIWFALSALISLWVGGWAAGRLAGVPNSKDGMLHGFTTWSITSLATILLLSTAVGGLIGGSASLLGKAGTITGQGAQAATPMLTNMVSQATGLTPSDVKQQAGDVATDPRFQTFASQIVSQGSVSPEARTSLVQLVAEKQSIPSEQANGEVTAWQQKLEQARDQAKSMAVTAADKTASGVSRAALWSFVALLLGAIAASIGGAMGSPKFTLTRRTVEPVAVRA